MYKNEVLMIDMGMKKKLLVNILLNGLDNNKLIRGDYKARL